MFHMANFINITYLPLCQLVLRNHLKRNASTVILGNNSERNAFILILEHILR